MSQLLSTIVAASEAAGQAAGEAAGEHGGAHGGAKEHGSEMPFFVLGGLLAVYAVAISVVGFKKPDFPGSAAAARGVMAFSTALVLATMVSIVYVSA